MLPLGKEKINGNNGKTYFVYKTKLEMKPACEKKSVNLEFKTRFTPKRGNKQWKHFEAFPFCEKSQRLKGIFTGLSVEVLDVTAIRTIYKNGFYGKGSQSRGAPAVLSEHKWPKTNVDSLNLNSDETLVLQLEEAFFLAYFLNILQIEDLKGNILNWQQMIKAAEQIDSKFISYFAGYLYLKSKGWVVKSGSKFGGDFTIYKDSPELFHASFIVHIVQPNETEMFIPKNIKGIQRVSETSNKDVLLMEILKPLEFELKSLEDFEKISVTETIVRRLKMSAFVQCPNVNK